VGTRSSILPLSCQRRLRPPVDASPSRYISSAQGTRAGTGLGTRARLVPTGQWGYTGVGIGPPTLARVVPATRPWGEDSSREGE